MSFPNWEWKCSPIAIVIPPHPLGHSETTLKIANHITFFKCTYLRVCLIFFRYSSSHARVLMARIPETTWFIKEMRRSDTAAVRSRNAALIWENPAKYGTRKHRKKTPIRDCQPIKYTSKSTSTSRTTHAENESKNSKTVSSSIRWTSFDIRSITWPVVNFNNASLLRSSVCETRNTYSISFTKQGFSWHNRCLWLRQVCELNMCLFGKKELIWTKLALLGWSVYVLIKDKRDRQPTILKDSSIKAL